MKMRHTAVGSVGSHSKSTLANANCTKRLESERRMSYLRVAVEHGKVGNDDGDGQGDRQHAGQCAQCPHEHADVSFGRHISIAHLFCQQTAGQPIAKI